jgi:hypothetical protein
MYNSFHDSQEQRQLQLYLNALTPAQRSFDLAQTLLYNRLQRNIADIHNNYSIELENVHGPDNNVNAEPRHHYNIYDEVFISGVNASRNNRIIAMQAANVQYLNDVIARSEELQIDRDEIYLLRATHSITQDALNNYYSEEIVQDSLNDPPRNSGGGKRKRKKSKTKHRKKYKMRKTNRRMRISYL